MTEQQITALMQQIARLNGVRTVEQHIINGTESVLVVSLNPQKIIIDAEFEVKNEH